MQPRSPWPQEHAPRCARCITRLYESTRLTTALREREPELRRLRMADAHPGRGGTDEEFMAARERYKRALRRAS